MAVPTVIVRTDEERVTNSTLLSSIMTARDHHRVRQDGMRWATAKQHFTTVVSIITGSHQRMRAGFDAINSWSFQKSMPKSDLALLLFFSWTDGYCDGTGFDAETEFWEGFCIYVITRRDECPSW